MSTFETAVYQNEYLAAGATEVDAIVRVTATGSGTDAVAADAVPTGAAEIVIVDTSGSMDHPRTKINEARTATIAAIDCLRDGVEFAVIQGAGLPAQVYPRDGGLAIAGEETREAARRAVQKIKAGGGTAMGRWLTAAADLFADSSAGLKHAILLTDGLNEGESERELEQALEHCIGRFQCDCRGVGADWEVAELRRIASALLGTVDLVREPEGLRAEFTAMMEQAMGKGLADVQLRVWTPRDAEVVFVKQVAPTIEDLTARRTTVSDQVGAYPTGAWGDESRDYHVRVRVPARALGEKMLAARVSLVVGDESLGESRIICVWTDDEAMSTRLDPEVAHATGQTDLADAIQQGFDALSHGDEGAATFLIGRAVKIAAKSGDTARIEALSRIVEIDDAESGTVRLKRDFDRIDAIELNAGSSKTFRLRDPDTLAPQDASP
jgi:hypothetical protein